MAPHSKIWSAACGIWLTGFMSEPALTREAVRESLERMTPVDSAVDLAAAREAEAYVLAAEADARRRSRDSAA